MADDIERTCTTAELHDDFMRRTGHPPALTDMIGLRERQAQRTHLGLHDRVLSGKKPLIAFVKKIFSAHDMVWTLWGDAEGGIGWDIVQGKALLDRALAPGSLGLGRYQEATIRVPDRLGSNLLLSGYGDGRSGPKIFVTKAVVLSVSLPSERHAPKRYDVIAAEE